MANCDNCGAENVPDNQLHAEWEYESREVGYVLVMVCDGCLKSGDYREASYETPEEKYETPS